MPFLPITENHILTGAPQRSGNLWLVPLIASPEMPRCPSYQSLEDAIAEGTLTISETSAQGTVSELLASNKGSEPVLILDGDLLAGAKQDRVANASMLLPARADTTIPVSCVEARRWAYTGHCQPQATDRAFFIQGRARKAASVSDNLKRSRRRTSDQQQVWSDIDGIMASLDVCSPTASVHDVYASREEVLEGFTDAFWIVPDQVGAVYASRDGCLGMDLFGSPDLFSTAFRKLLRGAGLDAHASASRHRTFPGTASEFLQAVGTAECDTYDAVGLGEEARLNDPALAGACLSVNGCLVHLSAFARA